MRPCVRAGNNVGVESDAAELMIGSAVMTKLMISSVDM